MPALEHQRFLAGLGRIGGADQPGVAGTEDDGVMIGIGCYGIPPLIEWESDLIRSFR